jgi:histone acetyltransferase MYST4
MGRDGVGVGIVSSGVGAAGPSQSPTHGDQAVMNLSITQGMMSTYLQFLQVQTQTGKMKLEYLRRREEREEKESAQRRELERLKLEREVAEFEHNKQKANMQQKADRALVRIYIGLVMCCSFNAQSAGFAQ